MSSGPFLCYRELIPSTGVLCSAFFSTNNTNFLVTSTSTSLNIYRIEQIDDVECEVKSKLQQVATFSINGFPRDICVIDMPSSSNNTEKVQNLLVSLDKGKLVLVTFDAMFNTLKVLNMYNVEDGAIGDSACPRTDLTSRQVYPGLGCVPFLTVDAQSHTACMSVNAYNLFFMTYKSQPNQMKPFSIHIPSLGIPGAIIDLCFIPGYSHPTLAILQDSLSLPIGHVKKVSNTVTLTVLTVNFMTQTCIPLWQQRKLPHDSCRLVPVNACDAVPAGVLVISLNAVLVCTQECVSGMATNGFAKLTVGAHIPLVSWPLEKGIELHASKWQEAASGTFVVCLEDGTLLLFRLESVAEDAVLGDSCIYYDVDVIGKSIEATCFSIFEVNAKCGADLHNEKSMIWFIGSSVSDCVLLDVIVTMKSLPCENTPWLMSSNPSDNRGNSVYFEYGVDNSSSNGAPTLIRGLPSSSSSSAPPPLKRLRHETKSANESNEIDSAMSKIDTEVSILYIGNSRQSNFAFERCLTYPELKVSVADSIVVLGPILGGNFYGGNDDSLCSTKCVTWDRSASGVDGNGKKKSSAAAYIADREARDTLEVSAGLGNRASLLRLSRGVHLSKLATRNFQHVTHSCTLPYEYMNESNSMTCYGTYFFLSEVQRVASGFRNRRFGDNTTNVKEDSKIVLATERLDAAGDKFVHMDELRGEANAFCTEQATVSIGLVRRDVAVQSCSQCLRLVRLTPSPPSGDTSYLVELEALQDVLVEEDVDMGGFGGSSDEYVVTADCCLSGWVVVLSSLDILYLFRYDPDDEMLMLYHKVLSTLNFDAESGLLMQISDHAGVNPHATQDGTIVSASIFHGHLAFQNCAVDVDKSSRADPESHATNHIWNKIAEETLLYGSELMNEELREGNIVANDSELEKQTSPDATKHDTTTSSTNELHNEQEAESECMMKTYAVIADRSGRVCFIELSTEEPRKIFQSFPLGNLSDYIPTGIDKHCIKSEDSVSPPIPPPKRYVTGVSLVHIGSIGRRKSMNDSKLCLVTVFNTGDIIVYIAITSTSSADDIHGPDTISCFRKLKHSLITRRKKGRGVKKGSTAGRFSMSGADLNMDYSSVSTSQAMMCSAMDSNGGQAMVISGARPILLCNTRGMLQVLPLCLPELPYAGVGVYVANYFTTGDTRGYSVLWREEKIEGGGHSNAGGMTSLSTLGLYTEANTSIRIPGSNMTVMRSIAGHTIHRFCEFVQGKTDDNTQKALLKTKTFAVLSSEKVFREWRGDVYSAEEKAEEEGTYDRFFKKMDSFADPSMEFGPPPLLEEDVYSICIMQAGGVIVDKYTLPEGERVLDMTIVYLAVEEPELVGSGGVISGAEASSGPVKKKAFVAVCTSIDDKHGEDTQGEGRLLFFSLDYALYQEDQEECVEREHVDNGTNEGTNEGKEEVEGDVNGENGIVVEDKDDTVVSTESDNNGTVSLVKDSTPLVNSSVEQARFLDAIKPKLKLIWTGPGPGSVVSQFKEKYLIATVGATLYLYVLNVDNMELEQVAFFFAQFYISTVSTMKDFILIGDAYQSVQFVVWREEDMSLTLLAKDYDMSACVTASCIFDGDTLAFVVSDDEANIQLMRFNPKVIESKKGFRLLNIADFHVGSTSTALIPHKTLDSPYRLLSTHPPPKPPPPSLPPSNGRMQVPPPPPPRQPPPPSDKPPPPPLTRRSMASSALAVSALDLGARFDKKCSNKSCLIVGTADGGLGILSPVDERVHKTLALLQQIMSTTVPTSCGLNPRQFRQLKCSRQRLEKSRGMLDGNLLWQFANLEGSLQDELAFAMGTTADTILDYMLEIDMLSSFF